MAKVTLASLEKRIKTLEKEMLGMHTIVGAGAKCLIDTDDYWQFHDALKKMAIELSGVVPDAL